jgi:hypothetical protein
MDAKETIAMLKGNGSSLSATCGRDNNGCTRVARLDANCDVKQEVVLAAGNAANSGSVWANGRTMEYWPSQDLHSDTRGRSDYSMSMGPT